MKSGLRLCLLLSLMFFLIPLDPGLADAPKRGGDLIIVHQDLSNLNPAIQAGSNTGVPGAQLFASLVELNEKFQPVPYLAKSWEVSEDQLTYTFRLVENAVFHDGRAVTSEDVAFSFEVVKAHHPTGAASLGQVNRVETPNPHTAVFKLEKPHPALLTCLSSTYLMPILPKHIYSTAPIRTHPANMAPVGCGPFKFAELKAGEHLILERFDKFFRPGRPYLDRLIFIVMKDASAIRFSLERGEAHFQAYSTMRLSDILRLGKLEHLAATRQGYAAVGGNAYLEFNLRNPPLNDLRVRQAIAYALDRDFITQKLHNGLSVKSTGPIVRSSPFYHGGGNKYETDLARANKILDEAGYPRKADGTRFTLTLEFQPTNIDVYRTPAEYLKPQLKNIGIDVQLRAAPDMASFISRVSNWQHEMVVGVIFNGADPTVGVHRQFLCSNQKKGVMWSNTEGYCNPRVDDILAKAGTEVKLEKRKALYAEFQNLVTEELPVIFTFEAPYYTIYHKNLRNVALSVWGALAPFDSMYWEKRPK